MKRAGIICAPYMLVIAWDALQLAARLWIGLRACPPGRAVDDALAVALSTLTGSSADAAAPRP